MLRGLVVVLPGALIACLVIGRLLPWLLPTTVPAHEYSGFFAPRQTLGFLALVAGAFLVLALAWRRVAGRPRQPVVAALVTALLFLAVQELAARFFLADLPRGAYAPDPLLRWDLHGFERAARGRVGAAPLRRDGEFRILCLGDSATYGVGVTDAQSWPRRVQAELAGTTSWAVRVINHGVPGYTTWQAMAWLEQEGLALEPDLVLFASCHNDHSDADEADPDWIGSTPLERRLHRLLMGPALAQVARALLQPPPRDPGIPSQARPGFRVSIAQRRAALDRVRELCPEGTLALVAMPHARQPWPACNYVADLRAYAREHQGPLADAQRASDEAENWRELFPPGDIVHPTAQGQEVVARTVVALLREERLIPPK